MSKGLLVMDMPEKCAWCPLGRLFGTAGAVECNVTNKINRNCESVPDWCPLRPMPEKKKKDSFLIEAIKNDCFDGTDSDTAYYNGKDDGWNACIDAIGGVDGEEAK